MNRRTTCVGWIVAALAALNIFCGGGGGGGSATGSGSPSAGSGAPLTSDFTPPTGAAAQPWPGNRGPWNLRLMTATSTDGLAWTRTNAVITDQGDVPDIVQDAQGWIYIYYTGWTVGAQQNKTCVAISWDGGATWVYKQLVLNGFEGFSGDRVDPDIQILSNGMFRLYVTGDPNDGQGPRCYYAEGTDGITFANRGVAFQKPAGSQPGANVLDPSTLLIGSTWHYFGGGGAPDQNWHGTSPDGTSFAFDAFRTFNDPDGQAQMFSNGTAFPGGIYRFYAFPANTVLGAEVNSFWTTDGVTWTADPGARLQLDATTGRESWGVKDAGVVRLADGTYLMVYVTQIP